ncbi:MAG: trehalose-6-phosphate synthase [Planctomycetes bacterium]|nr:trehalose-6-phosphate synthase [Planctomycetota bacterium]
MRLAKVTIAGFKSFADTTEFRFDVPIAGIVGPNGCGKSNVVDAIKWVLGERSAKSLRGEAMLDVIFAGSAARKPLGAATVTLTFDNPVTDAGAADAKERRFLAIDTEQVDVTRRLYRDGGSEYLINGRRCRLRDIKELFMDTGIGTNAYSTIEQGRVDAMLTANPIERRVILEEAAGIAMFRARKIEAARKLERTEVNLIRVREQLEQTERRLRVVRRQAAKARRRRELDARSRQIRLDLALDLYHGLRERLDGLKSRIGDLEIQRKHLEEVLRQLEEEKQSAQIGRHELEGRQRDLERQRLELVAARKHAEQRRDLTDRNLTETRQHVDDDRGRLDDLTRRIDRLDAELTDAESAIAAAAERVAEAERAVGEANDERARSQQALVESQQSGEQARARVNQSEQQQVELLARLESSDGQAEGLKQQAAGLDARSADLQGEIAVGREQHAEAEARLSAAQDQVKDLAARLAEHDRTSATLGERQAALSERLADLRQQQAAVETRLHLLEEMHQAREGLTRAVKAVLDQPDRFPGVRGVLGDALETDRKGAALVEAALGANLELLLVRRMEDLKTLEAATRQLPGRVGFIAMEGITQPPPEDPTGAAPGWVTPILSMIEVTPEARAAVERLLGRTVVVWDLEAALMLGSGPLAGWRFVTRHREVVEPDGRVTTGPAGSATGGDGWLSRRIERADLGLRLAALNGQIEETSQELDRLTADSAQTQQQRAQVAQELHTARHRVVEKQYQAQRQASDLDRIERERARVSGEREEVDQRLERLGRDHRELQDRLAALTDALADQREAAEHAQSQPESIQDRCAQSQDRLTAAKVELGRNLFFEKRLSSDNTISCASCHHPDFGFTDGSPVSTGIRGQKGGRSAPTVINRAYSVEQFWDGRDLVGLFFAGDLTERQAEIAFDRVLGVDRLDYSKGIPLRIEAYGRFLQSHPEWRGRVRFEQWCAPSRQSVPAYREELATVERLVAGLAAEEWFGEDALHFDLSVHPASEVAAGYREARVCLVTSLADGMNLVAKEFVAVQPPADPGVLVLSRGCGAAEELTEALLVDPGDVDGTADAIARALEMPLDERIARWEALHSAVEANTALMWRDRFVRALAE